MRDVDAFVCDGCGRQMAGSPVAYWSNMGVFTHSTGGGPRKISLEFCPACTTAIQQAIGDAPRLPRARHRSLLARLGLCG